jgi:3,4-dihydroxy 2-butanone 4-phosphate synthase/GTP cyclohydrolase II
MRKSEPASEIPPPLELDPDLLGHMQQVISDVRDGKMVILVDDEDRENEGDLMFAAEKVTPEQINFMAKFGRGLICLALTETQVERLELPMMSLPKWRGGPALGTAFTLSIEARHGVTTGISAADRAHTVRVAIAPAASPEDIITPGHVFPLKARRGGVLVRAGQTEGAVDLARLAGCNPSGVICEIMNDDGSMARLPDLERFAAEHGLKILTIADLIRYRLQTEQLVQCRSERSITLDQTGSEWRAMVFGASIGDRQLLVLVKGDLATTEPVLCRMHGGSVIGDLFSSSATDGGRNLREAIDRIEREGRGVIVYLPSQRGLDVELQRLQGAGDDAAGHEAHEAAGQGRSSEAEGSQQRGALREYGLGAQVLRELGLHKIRLLSNNPRKIAGIRGYGLEVVETVPLKGQ